ncbi:uncharacterized protein BX664DRAFT_72576 [Halteromyces radiatus]|uniref:uncharacterized protein n=1 Tax=Halteromyces radiatus TaxID=101107 RepID=UPI00221FAA35|nr:uncharacterized protein BX664DRAFT_72576 [Halteromyces radiatus]KAI8097083.1 hypothetical protein BX664DRAFT_72576 [Halteromyces radiatus]
MCDLNWCPICEKAIDIHSESLYCSEACCNHDALKKDDTFLMYAGRHHHHCEIDQPNKTLSFRRSSSVYLINHHHHHHFHQHQHHHHHHHQHQYQHQHQRHQYQCQYQYQSDHLPSSLKTIKS